MTRRLDCRKDLYFRDDIVKLLGYVGMCSSWYDGEKVKEVNKWKEELLEQKRRMIEEKQLRAEYKRELQIQAIVKKAQEEDAKVWA